MAAQSLSTTTTLMTYTYAAPAVNLNIGDRVMVVVILTSNTPATRTGTIYMAGTAHPSNVLTPIASQNVAIDVYRFGASGVVATGQQAPTHYVEFAGTATALTITASAGTLTAQIESSTNGGSTWSVVGAGLALSSGLSAASTMSVPLIVGTLLRVNYTATSSGANPVVSLYVQR